MARMACLRMPIVTQRRLSVVVVAMKNVLSAQLQQERGIIATLVGRRLAAKQTAAASLSSAMAHNGLQAAVADSPGSLSESLCLCGQAREKLSTARKMCTALLWLCLSLGELSVAANSNRQLAKMRGLELAKGERESCLSHEWREQEALADYSSFTETRSQWSR